MVSGSRDATLHVWNVESGQCLHVLMGHMAAVRCVQYDGKRVVSGAYDYTVRVWDRTRKAVFTYSTAILTGSTHYRYKDTWGRGENRLAPGQKVGLGLFLVDSFRLGWGSFRGWAWIGFGWSNMTCMSLASVCKTLQGKWCDTTQNNTTQHDTISHNTSPPALQGKSKNTCTWVK